MDLGPNKESCDELDSAQSFDTRQNAASCFECTAAMFGSASIGNEINVNGETVSSTAINGVPSAIEETPMFVYETSQDERKRYLEDLKEENLRLKAMSKCYGCKTNPFSFALFPCTHTACETCAENELCACTTGIREKYPCRLPTSNK